jgi:SsrA-binding protein
MSSTAPKPKTFENRRARYDYHILDTMEVGVCLKGWEVKALRAGHLHFNGSWIKPSLQGWTWHAEITPLLQSGTHVVCEPWSDRTLLLSKSQRAKWTARVQERGLTIIPMGGHFKGPWFKLTLALAKGKQLHDKRESIKSRDLTRSLKG